MTETPMSPDATFVVDGDEVFLVQGDNNLLLAIRGSAREKSFLWLVEAAAAFHKIPVKFMDEE